MSQVPAKVHSCERAFISSLSKYGQESLDTDPCQPNLSFSNQTRTSSLVKALFPFRSPDLGTKLPFAIVSAPQPESPALVRFPEHLCATVPCCSTPLYQHAGSSFVIRRLVEDFLVFQGCGYNCVCRSIVYIPARCLISTTSYQSSTSFQGTNHEDCRLMERLGVRGKRERNKESVCMCDQVVYVNAPNDSPKSVA